MGPIVCAIRGGSFSQATIDKAIALAQETSLPICFLYIVNLDFLSRTTSLRTHTINNEMEQMGAFILLAAQSQAADQGAVAEGLVRHGTVGEEIIALCQELGASYLVLGRPQKEEDEGDVFSQSRLKVFADIVKLKTGAQVVMPESKS